MSEVVKVNLSMCAAVTALVTTVAGGVWAASSRSSDLNRIQEKHDALEHRVESNTQRSDKDHDTITAMAENVKITRIMVEELLKRRRSDKQEH